MASKKSRAKAGSKRPKAIVKKKAVVKTKAKAPAKKAASASAAPARAHKERKLPETLRLKSFTPSLTVNDLPKSIDFYTEGLGFIISERWADGDVLRGVMLKAGASELGLSQDDGKLGADRKKGLGFRLWCDSSQSLDSIAGRLKSKGHALTQEPADNPAWGVRSFSFDDPDGFHFTFAQDLPKQG
jgi:catechol 2,3-dioxygenase-like lactoylglutathione lyase family enzyme